jgi:hypothetical protein
MIHELTAELKERLHYSAIWYLEKGEYSPLTDEEERSVKTFYALEESVDQASATVIEHMVELNGEASRAIRDGLSYDGRPRKR